MKPINAVTTAAVTTFTAFIGRGIRPTNQVMNNDAHPADVSRAQVVSTSDRTDCIEQHMGESPMTFSEGVRAYLSRCAPYHQDQPRGKRRRAQSYSGEGGRRGVRRQLIQGAVWLPGGATSMKRTRANTITSAQGHKGWAAGSRDLIARCEITGLPNTLGSFNSSASRYRSSSAPGRRPDVGSVQGST